MPQSLAEVYVHLVFSTKDRSPWLADTGLRHELYPYMATILRDHVDSISLEINGVEDHVHALLRLSRKLSIMKVVQGTKVETSKWLKRASTQEFTWQSGYGAFSVSASMLNEVKQYIQSQEEHHKRMSFQEEFREMCRRHGVHWDERHVWG